MIIRLQGGLGNTLFQYAFGVSLGAARNEPVTFSSGYMGRPYGLDAYVAQVRFSREAKPEYREPGFTFDPNAVNAPRGATFIGYWQTEKYFNERLVRQAFTLRKRPSDRTQAMADTITQAGEASAFLHVRRGDYVNNAYHGMPSMDYYMGGIKTIQASHNGAKFFVFSDEPGWCKANFPGFTVVDHNAGAPHEDILLMSMCRHGVLANSSFSWWGAWLGGTQPDRIVIAPQKWFLADLDTRDLIPERWRRL